jgi:hypothetical protein
MKRKSHCIIFKSTCLFLLGCLLSSTNLFSQQTQTQIRDYVIFSGNGGPGTVAPPTPGYGTFIGSSITINGGSIGSLSLVQSTGNSFFSTNIYSAEKVIISNSNVITGRIAAANLSSLNQTILQVGSSASIGGNIDVKGNIVIGGGTVSGTVTHPLGTTYSGPAPGQGEVFGTPNLPLFPALPSATSFPAAGNVNISNNRKISPGEYGDVNLGSNKTLTLDGAGVYVFNSIHFSGNSTNLVFGMTNLS